MGIEIISERRTARVRRKPLVFIAKKKSDSSASIRDATFREKPEKPEQPVKLIEFEPRGSTIRATRQ